MQRRSFSRELKVEAVRLVKRFDEVSLFRPPRLSSVTRMASTLRALASARTLARSGRALSAPDAVSLDTGHDLVAGTLGERPQVLSWRSNDWSSVETRQ